MELGSRCDELASSFCHRAAGGAAPKTRVNFLSALSASLSTEITGCDFVFTRTMKRIRPERLRSKLSCRAYAARRPAFRAPYAPVLMAIRCRLGRQLAVIKQARDLLQPRRGHLHEKKYGANAVRLLPLRHRL